MPNSQACGLTGTSRIDIFHDLAVDNLTNMIDMNILDRISADNYQKFIDFCNQVEIEKDSILSISCILEGDNLELFINYKD